MACLDQIAFPKAVEVIFGGDSGIVKLTALVSDCGQRLGRIEVDDINDEVVGMLHLDTVAGGCFDRKILRLYVTIASALP